MSAKIESVYQAKQTTALLRCETIDRLDSVVNDLPKYKCEFADLIGNFTIDKTLQMLHAIDRDREFKTSKYYHVYNEYFDEIEEMIFTIVQ